MYFRTPYYYLSSHATHMRESHIVIGISTSLSEAWTPQTPPDHRQQCTSVRLLLMMSSHMTFLTPPLPATPPNTPRRARLIPHAFSPDHYLQRPKVNCCTPYPRSRPWSSHRHLKIHVRGTIRSTYPRTYSIVLLYIRYVPSVRS